MITRAHRFIVGSFFFLLTCLSVVFGISYPFWIGPALIMLFTVGTGYPANNIQVSILKSKSNRKGDGETMQKHGAKSTSGSGFVSSKEKERQLVGDLLTRPTAVFNHLVCFSADVSDPGNEENITLLKKKYGMASLHPSAHTPTLKVQVYSIGGWFGRHRLEGYGYAHLSDKAMGLTDVVVDTWRPVGSISSKVNDFFLGDSVRLKDHTFVDTISKISPAVNKFGVLTESSGSVRLRYQVIVTDPRTVKKDGEDGETVGLTARNERGQLKAKRTVEDILNSFRSSMSGPAAVSSLLQTGISTSFSGGSASRLSKGGSSSSSSSSSAGLKGITGSRDGGKPTPSVIMDSVNEKLKKDKVASILAAAKAHRYVQ